MNIACVIPLNDIQEEEEVNDSGEGSILRWQNYRKGEKKSREGTMKVERVAITSGAQRGS